MKVLVLGVTHMSGIGKKSNAPYGFAKLNFASFVERVRKPTMTIIGSGYEAKDGLNIKDSLYLEM